MKSSKDKLNITNQQDRILESAYAQLLVITKKSNSINELMDQVQAYLRENPAAQSLLENPSKSRNFILKILNEDVLHKKCDSKEDLEGYRIYLGCLAIHIIKNANPSFDEEEIVYDCINKVINSIYLEILKDSDEPSRKYSFYGNIRSILLDEFRQYIDLYFEDDSFRDLILKLFKEELEFHTSKIANFTPSSNSIIYYFYDYVRFLDELNRTLDTDGIFDVEYAFLMNSMKNLSGIIYSNCESFYQNLIKEIEAILGEQVDLIENDRIINLTDDSIALNTTLKLLSSIKDIDKNIQNGIKKFETKLFPKIFLNYKSETLSLFQKAEEAQVEFSANQILETYKKYDKLITQGATVKLNDEICQFVNHFYKHPSDIYQRELIKSLFNSIIKPKTKIKAVDSMEKEIDIFFNLHKIALFISNYQRVTANQLIVLQEQDIDKYFNLTKTEKKESSKNQKSQTNSSAKNKKNEKTKKQTQTVSSAKSIPGQLPVSPIVVSTEKPKKEGNPVQITKTAKKPNKKGNKNKRNRTKKKPQSQSDLTISTQSDLLVSNPTTVVTHELSDSEQERSVRPKVDRFLSFIPLAALNHMKRISESGYQVFMFGGAVRDILWKDLGRNDDLKYNDIDLITNIPESLLIELFPYVEKSKFIPNLWHVRNAGDDYSLTTVDIKLVPQLNLTNLFCESYLAVDSLACDLTGKIYDPLDVFDKFLMPELQLVSNEKPHFKNNPERILKAVKTASHLPADLSEPLIEMIIEHKQELSKLDLSHMLSLLARICLKQQGDIGFKMLIRLELIDSLFPILGEKIQSCSSKNSVIHRFMHEKFESFNKSDLPCSKYSLLAVFLIPYFEKIMSLDKKYYSKEEINTKLDIFLTKANIKPNEKSLWSKKTLEYFITYWKEFEAYEVNKRYNVTFTPGYQAILGNSSITRAQDPTNISKARIAP